MTLQTRGIQAAIRFLERKDYEIVDKIPSRNIDIIAMDNEDILHFITVTVSEDTQYPDVNEIKENRPILEREAMKWLMENDSYTDIQFYFDTMDMLVVGENRAMLRHHINCLSAD